LRSGIGAIWVDAEGVLKATGDRLNHVRTCATTLNSSVDTNFTLHRLYRADAPKLFGLWIANSGRFPT
jgi:hypothetical protein